MDFKKKTIIGDENTEPPKNYIGVKNDGNFYEYDPSDRKGKESTLIPQENVKSKITVEDFFNEIASVENRVAPDLYCHVVDQPTTDWNDGTFQIVNDESLDTLRLGTIHMFYKDPSSIAYKQAELRNTSREIEHKRLYIVGPDNDDELQSVEINGEVYYTLVTGTK